VNPVYGKMPVNSFQAIRGIVRIFTSKNCVIKKIIMKIFKLSYDSEDKDKINCPLLG
jgi:hypothetical protein